jgi:hypothetical protein
MKSWVAAPSLFCAGSRVDHAPEYPALSRTVIEPPVLTGEVAIGELDELDELGCVDDGVVLLGLLLLLLHAAAVVTASTAAPARQAVRIDVSRKLTAFTYS